MTVPTDAELYGRGSATLLASWEQYARGCRGAAVVRLEGVTAAVFPHEPERSVYNNALLDRDLAPGDRTTALEAMIAAYRSASVDRYAAWVHESDAGMRAELSARGFTVTETTLAMGRSLDDAPRAATGPEIARAGWASHLRYLEAVGVPSGLLAHCDGAAFHVLEARLAGKPVGTGMAFDHAGDCGVFNVGTLESARRRGLGTAVTLRLLSDAAQRGCSTASLQSTPMAEGVYRAAGFRDLGRILEFSPP